MCYSVETQFIIFILVLFVFLVHILAASRKEYSPPRIFPEDKAYILSVNHNFTLRCEGKQPVTWKPPNNTNADLAKPKYSTVTISASKTPDTEYIYGAILTIQNASYLDTGFYYCHEETTDMENLSRVSNIYVYIDDPEQSSLMSEYTEAITVPQYSEGILPCRPTSPFVDVELLQTTGEELQIEIVSYDPKVGFKIYTNDLLGYFIYSCRFTRKNLSGNDTIYDLDIPLLVSPITSSIAKPFLEDLSGGHTVVGESLTLKCTLTVNIELFAMNWITPDQNGMKNGRIHVSKILRSPALHDTYYQELTINETTFEDQGEYTCAVQYYSHKNNHTKYIKIFDKGDHFINLTEENGVYDISAQAGESNVRWRIDVKAHPFPKLVWHNNKGEEIQAGWSDNKDKMKYEVYTQGSDATTLTIYNITIEDRGFYKLKAINDFEESTLDLFLNVTGKPAVKIQTANFHMINEPSLVECLVAAYPYPSIDWFYKACQDDSCDFQPQISGKTEIGMLSKSYLNITANQSGYIMCEAKNPLGMNQSIVEFIATDVNNGFGIWGLDTDTLEKENGTLQFPVAKSESITLYCAAARYNYTDHLKWFKNSGHNMIELENNDHYAIEKSNTIFSHKITLSIYNVDYEDSGNYTCQVKNIFNVDKPVSEEFHDNITVAVRDPEMPRIAATNLNKAEIATNTSNNVELWCYARGIPKPTISWYKNGEDVVENTSDGRIQLEENNQRMIIRYIAEEDEGSYTCSATNKVGTVQKQIHLLIENRTGYDYKYLILLIAMPILFIPPLLYMFLRFRKERNLRRELKSAGLANFENGALESLNPELGVDDQAELLPYDRIWEFPREKLKLGKQLGAGAFGVVMKAEATGITESEETTTVAVKMVKRNADYTYIKSLASELKIMVHLGKHLNVVNLLGACTKNVAKQELLVIVEYCRYGNLQNYLLQHRDSFINQIDVETGQIDYTLGADILERSFFISSDKSNFSPLANSTTDYRGNFSDSGETAYTASTTVSFKPTAGGDYILFTSNNKDQPEWRSNYCGDYKGNVKPICTKDLITWAFQVARGMEYLASRKVLHGDLAARNVLLAENNIVKICDFGLAKSIYKSDNYKKKGDGLLPVKWMAIESIRDLVFSTQSDIWSYGVVLWEFFSLARTPYPGMEADERLYYKLVDGYRMDSPEFATNEIYKIMSDCWDAEPLSRPSFTKMADTIGRMLEESERQHCIDLNDPYQVMNTQRLKDGHRDYLAMLSPPDFEYLSSPRNYIIM